MGKLLISGSGKGHPAIMTWWIYGIIGVALGIGCMYLSRNSVSFDYGWQSYFTDTSSKSANYLYYIGIAIIVASIVDAIFKSICISKTKIDVYEDRVEGIGVRKYFLMGNYRTQEFKLTLDQVANMEVTSSSITIITADTQYRPYVKNAAAIQGIITEQKARNRPS